MLKCPHCGLEVFDEDCDPLTPDHKWFPVPSIRTKCPGSGQHPRGLADRRPPCKDLPVDAR